MCSLCSPPISSTAILPFCSQPRLPGVCCLPVTFDLPLLHHRLIGVVVKARAADAGFDSRLRRGDFSGSGHTSDLGIVPPVANLPGAWRYRVSAGTGWPGVNIL